MRFREKLVLLDGRTFGEAMATFQREDFAALDSGAFRHAYLERPRGHSKTTDVAAEAVVELFLGPPGGRLYAAAVDRDQAALLHESAVGLIRRTPRLSEAIRIERWRIILPARDSMLTVLSADAPSAYGLQPTWIACDELAQWPDDRGEELWNALWTATGKRSARMIVITTAGWDQTSLCWRVREMAQREPDWYFSSRGQCAPWIDPNWLEQQRRTLPPHVFARLHESRWVEGAGAFLTAAEVASIFDASLRPMLSRPPGATLCVIGVDLGLTHDRAVATVAFKDAHKALVVAYIRSWEGRRSEPVSLASVEEEVLRLAREFQAEVIVDPYQAALMAERLRAKGVRVTEYAFTAESRRKLFGVLLQVVKDGLLRSFPHEELRRELLSLEVTESSAGWRVDHRPGRHDDHVVSLALAVHGLVAARPEPRIWVIPMPEVVWSKWW